MAELKGIFMEIIIAPEYTEDALRRLRKRKNLRILRMPVVPPEGLQLRSIQGGILVRSRTWQWKGL